MPPRDGGRATSSPTSLFAYGTLLPGEVRWPFLAPFVEDEGDGDAVAGTLYDTGEGYPAAVFEGRPAGVIHGRTFGLVRHRIEEAVATLDEVEGAVDGLYHRIVRTSVGGTAVWVYQYGGGLALRPITSGSWLDRD